MEKHPFRRLPAKSPSDFARQSEESRCSPSQAADAAAQLLGCYRKGEAADPHTYATAIAAVLSCYRLDVVAYVCDPRTGLPSVNDFLPTVAEVRSACEARIAPEKAAAARRRHYELLDRQRLLLARPAEESDAKRAEVAGRVKAVADRIRGGLTQDPQIIRREAEEKLAQLMATAHLPIPVSKELRARMAAGGRQRMEAAP